jgi:hypothetical protein
VNHFIVQGGLEKLVLMMADKNLFVRGQAIEIFMNIVDCDVFDWFNQPTNELELSVHKKLLGLMSYVQSSKPASAATGPVKSCLLLRNTILNRENTYPGGSLRALQLMAFWLSWVRVMYTDNRVLFLSEDVLDILNKWGTGSAESVTEDELKLAKTLFDDFGTNQFEALDGNESAALPTAPPNPLTVSSDNSASSKAAYQGYYIAGVTRGPSIGSSNESDRQSASTVVSAPNVSVPSQIASQQSASSVGRPTTPPRKPSTPSVVSPSRSSFIPLMSRLDTLKREGNEHFGKTNFESAIAVYQQMLKHIDDFNLNNSNNLNVPINPTNAAEVVNVHATACYNIAASYWRIYQQHAKQQHSPQQQQFLQTTLLQCESASQRALDLAPTHTKAAFRLAATWLELRKAQQALDFIDQYVGSFAAKSNHGTMSVADMSSLQQLRHECVAAILLSSSKKTLGDVVASDANKRPSTNGPETTKKSTEANVCNKESAAPAGADDSLVKKSKSKTKSKSKLTISDGLAKLLELDEEPTKPVQKSQDELSAVSKQGDAKPKVSNEEKSSKAPLLSDKTAKMLEALQKRTAREKNRVTHAWVDWAPPQEEPK